VVAIRIQAHKMRPRWQNSISPPMPVRTLVPAVLLAAVIMASGCRHARVAVVIPAADTAPQTRKIRSAAVDHTVDSIIANPTPYLNRDVTVSGIVRNVETEKHAKGLTVLTMEVKDVSSLNVEIDADENRPQLLFADHLRSTADHLRTAVTDYQMVPVDVEAFEQLSYSLRIAGSKVSALSHYFRAQDMMNTGDAVEQVAKGYFEFGEAFATIAEIGKETPATIELEKSVIEDDVVTTVEETKAFQDNMISAASELLRIAELLIDQRRQLSSAEVLFEYRSITRNIGYTLRSVGDILEADAWAFRKTRNRDAEKDYREISRAFRLLGEGITNINGGFRDLGEKLAARYEPGVMRDDSFPTLKCAYIGYNKDILRDCAAKVDQLGGKDPIIIHGRLHKGNLREQVDLLWLNMHSVTLDGLTINLAYDDETSTRKNLQSFYGWAKDIED